MMTSEKFPVYLAHCRYDRFELEQLLTALAADSGFAQSMSGKKVLLKPNLISSMASPLACTDANFLAAVARFCIDQGARVFIGDSPAFGSAGSVLRRFGMLELLKGLPVEIVSFRAPVPLQLACGVQVAVAKAALDCDLLLNLPKLKAHSQLYLTAAVKNLFGLVAGSRKALLHMTHGDSHQRFAEILLDLSSLPVPQFSLVDGITAMHVSGPVTGRALPLGLVAAGANPLAVDTALLAALELKPENSPLWRLAASRHHPASQPANIIYPFSKPADFHGSGFIAPDQLNSIRFHPVRFMVSTCKRLLLALRHR